MALKPTHAEVVKRKRALETFMRENAFSAQDICDLLNSADSLKQVSQRTVQSWLADADLASSRTPPENLGEILNRRMAERGRQAS